MEQTPKANRVHIGFFGCCNAGKSTLINMLTDQPVSLVSEVAGTTTDPVSKSMEILPLGPVVITDTAGIDDTSELGALRIEKSEEVIKKINLAVYVLRDDEAPTADDMMWLNKLKQNNVPIALFINEINGSHGESTNNNQNLANESNGTHQGYIDTYPELAAIATVVGSTDFTSNRDRLTLLDLLGGLTPLDVEGEQSLLQGLVDPGDTIILVCPIDSAAPKGRLILPQVQTIREILDHKGLALVCQTEELPTMLNKLSQKPKLVITDSQAFEAVNACDDIGTVKIPMWLKKKGYTDLQLEFTSGGAFPKDVSGYDLIIHCGACMLTRREVLRRIDCAVVQGTPIVNYGVLIASLHGILERAISPFMDELDRKGFEC